MNKYYRLSICGLLALLLMATGTLANAAPQNKTYYKNSYKNYIAFQDKKTTTKDSLVRPNSRYKRPDNRNNKALRYNYRQNTARDALKSGRIVSLGVIRKRVKQSFPGKIVDVRLLEPKRSNKAYYYKVKVLRKDGKLLELKVNAANAKIVGVKGNK